MQFAFGLRYESDDRGERSGGAHLMRERRPCMASIHDAVMTVRLRALAAGTRVAPVPVLCLTAMSRGMTERLAHQLNKPVSVDRLLMEVEERCHPE